MGKRILVTYQLLREGYSELLEKYDVTFPPEGRESFSYEEVFQMLPDYDVLQPVFNFPVDRKMLERGLPRLKLICNYGAGYDNIDIVSANEFGITVTNTADPVTEPTADLAFGLMLAVSRRIADADRRLRTPEGVRRGLLENLGYSLQGKTLGIIGMGRIGKAIARRACASNMRIIYNSRHNIDPDIEEQYRAIYCPFERLLQTADYISVNVPYNSQTFHMIGKRELEMMKPTAILINTARGPIIDEMALIEALKQKRIYGAGLDVFEFDDIASKELLELDNVVLTPHLGTQTYDVRNEMSLCVSRNIINFFEGGPVSCVTE